MNYEAKVVIFWCQCDICDQGLAGFLKIFMDMIGCEQSNSDLILSDFFYSVWLSGFVSGFSSIMPRGSTIDVTTPGLNFVVGIMLNTGITESEITF